MDVMKLVEIFRGTFDGNYNQAEKQLEQIHKIIGFLPTVLQIVMETNIELPVRQAAVIYFKNEVFNHWESKESKNNQQIFSIHEQDRQLIRNSIIDALVLSTDVIRNSLSLALNYIIKYDFPHKFTVTDKIVYYLQTNDPNNWMGALMVLMELAKNYEYKNNEQKQPLLDVMKILAPILYKMMIEILPDNSEHKVLMQKTILKIIFIITQYSLPLSLFTEEFFTQWMEIIRQVLDRPVPNEVNNFDIEERYELPWYKSKKWALHIIVRIFERYGPSKGQSKEYKQFGRWYMETFSVGIIQVILKMLDQYNQKVYLPQRVLQQAINYLNTCVEHIYTWKILKPNISQIIEKVIFPLLCYTEEDDELWQTDPAEYVRKKFDFFEDYVSPVSAAQQFLCTCCKKRKDMLKNTIGFAIQILNSNVSTSQYKDGALHMLGSVSDIMLKKKMYHQQINDMLAGHVFPFFNSDHPFLRARAAWILHFFEDFEFENQVTLCQAINCLQYALIHDKELPVKVQAAISLQILIVNQEKTRPLIEPNLDTIIIECLNIVKISHNDDVSSGLQRLICAFGEKILPIAAKIVSSLVEILESILKTNDENNDATITIMGSLNTIDTVLMLIDDQETLSAIEPIAMKNVMMILDENLKELYEECFNIVTTLTDKKISNDMWKIYEYIYKISMSEEGPEYFADMMPALHNLITVDPDAFISDQNRVVALFEICKYILNYDCIDEFYCNVIKIIEVFLLQFREKVSNLMPSFCEIVMDKYILMDDLKTSELKTLSLQVLLVVLYIDSGLFFQIIEKLQQKYPNKNILDFILEEWLMDIKSFLGLHDRKICILALCKLFTLPANMVPNKVRELAPKFAPELLKMFDNLKEAYKAKAVADSDSTDTDSEYASSSDDEDVFDDDVHNPKEKMDDCEFIDDEDNDEDSDDDDDLYDNNENDLTDLENFETTIDKEDSYDDEYILFRKCIEYLKNNDINLYNSLFGNLTPQQISTLEDVFVLAQRRQDAAESRKIEQGGGYMFSDQTIPTNFNFGGGNFAINNHH
uniref:Importin-7 isoform X1 n=1 Tax=Psoroptes ovis TaxID=83912 RepID=A0A3B0QJF0_PSOOV|nr:importin-7 isoform X1 [Psoroptes ovis]